MEEKEKPVLTLKEERFRKKVQSQIAYCTYCQPYDSGEPVWIYGTRAELDELFEWYDVPAEYWERIMKHLRCPNCRNESFSLGIEIGTQSKYEKDVEKNMNEAYGLYGNGVRLLEEELEKFPLLGLHNKIAKKIFKEIDNKSLPITSVKGEFFRARKVDTSDIIEIKEMYNPPVGKALDGRFNHAGQSHLYLSNDKETALKEALNNKPAGLVWLQKFEIKVKVENILDLSFDWGNLTPTTNTLLLSLKVFDSIGRKDRNRENWKPDYYLTRFIMDCAKKSGYNGIKYDSIKGTSSYNLVLFYREKIIVQPIGSLSVEIFLKEEKIAHPKSFNYNDLLR